MYKNFFTLILLFAAFTAIGQGRKEWQKDYKLTVLDFEAEAPKNQEGQGQSYYLAANIDYKKATSLKLAINLNQYVTAYFMPAQSWLQQGEGTEILLKYAQMDFDLLELYARKYRQRLYEEKKYSANLRLLQRAQQEVNTNLAKRREEMQNAIAESDSKANAFHEQLLKEIAALAQFSKESVSRNNQN